MISKFKKKGKRKFSKKHEGRHLKIKARESLQKEVTSYIDMLRNFDEVSRIIYVLDARNPAASRYAPLEPTIQEKIIFVLNKIDMVPKEAATGWLAVLSKTAPTIAVSAINSIEPLENYLKTLLENENKLDLFVTGVGNVGKHTIMNRLQNMENITVKCSEKWTWLQPTPDLLAIGATAEIPPGADIVSGACDLLSRCSIQSLMNAFNTTFYGDPERYVMMVDPDRKKGARDIFDGFVAGKWNYYTAPPSYSNLQDIPNISDAQVNALKYSTPYDMLQEPMIMLGYGTINSLKQGILPIFQMMAMESDEETTTDTTTDKSTAVSSE